MTTIVATAARTRAPAGGSGVQVRVAGDKGATGPGTKPAAGMARGHRTTQSGSERKA
jgi:hypothetical protein